MFVACLYIVAIWLGLWIVFFGWGTLAFRVSGCQREDATALLVAPWAGMAVVIALLQLWHFAAPVNGWALTLVAAVGVAGALALGRRTLAILGSFSRAHPALSATTFLLWLWIANRSLNTQEFNDHGLYYLNAIRWASDHPLVVGLAHLENRLGFNNANFLLHAMLEIGSWRGYTAHLVNGFVVALTVPIVIECLWNVLNSSGGIRRLGWFGAAIGMLAALSAIDHRISSASPDLPSPLFATIAAWRLMALGLVEADSHGSSLRWNLVAFALCSAAAVAIKTSVIFFVALAWGAALVTAAVLERRRESGSLAALCRAVGWMLGWCALLAVPWILRGYALSGYPLFPASFGRAPVEWAVAPNVAAELRDCIYAYARTTDQNRAIGYDPGWAWVPHWLVQVVLLRSTLEVVAPIGVALSCAGWLALFGRKSTPSEPPPPGRIVLPLLLVVYLASLVLWIVTAPSPRMGMFACWGLAGVMLAWASGTIPKRLFDDHRRLILLGFIVLFLTPMTLESILIETRYRYRPKMPEFGKHFYHYHPFVLPETASGFPALPIGELQRKTTNSGLEMYVTVGDGLPWDSPLPATRFFNEHLLLRRPNELRSGFMIAPGVEQHATIRTER